MLPSSVGLLRLRNVGVQVVAEVAEAERPAPQAAEGRTNDRFVPLPQVAVLVERAVGARRGRVGADVGERVRATGEARRTAHGVAVVEAVGDAVVIPIVHRRGVVPRLVAHRDTVAAGGVVEVHARRAGRGVVVGRLVPLVFAGDPELGVGRTDFVNAIADSVRACFSVSAALAVVQPVGESHRVEERDERHRVLLAARLGDELAAVGGARLQLDAAEVARHVRVVERQRVGAGRVDRVEERRVLGVGDFVLADVVRVVDAAVAVSMNVIGVSGVADRGPVERNRVSRCTKSCGQ